MLAELGSGREAKSSQSWTAAEVYLNGSNLQAVKMLIHSLTLAPKGSNSSCMAALMDSLAYEIRNRGLNTKDCWHEACHLKVHGQQK